jgi:hypothetical protein
MVAGCEHAPIVFSLSGDNAHDSPEGEKLLDKFRRLDEQIYMLKDKAYEGKSMLCKIEENGLIGNSATERKTRREKGIRQRKI